MNPPTKSGPGRLIAIIVLSVLLVISLIFGYSYYSKAKDYKDNVDKKIAVAVVKAKADQAVTDKAGYDELLKAPYKLFTSLAAYGSISFSYPKTYNVYLDSSDNAPVNGYFNPGFVPGTSTSPSYALRLELVTDSYAQVLQSFDGQITDGALKAAAYLPPKMKGVKNVQSGTMFTGTLDEGNNIKGQMLVITVRDKTLKIYTQSNNYLKDFDNIILPSLTFVP